MSQFSVKAAGGVLLAGILMLGLTSAAEAQQAPPRIRGELTKVDGNNVTIKSPDG
jgi:hypothetical protein